MLHDSTVTVDVYPPHRAVDRPVYVIGGEEEPATRLAHTLGLGVIGELPSGQGGQPRILIDDYAAFAGQEAAVLQAVAEAATAIFVELRPEGIGCPAVR